MNKSARIFVAGHRGLVGAAVTRKLRSAGYTQLLLRDRQQLDLTNQAAVESFFAEHKPEYVVLAAAKVGGIHANATFSADFIQENLLIQANVIGSAYRHSCRKLLFLGSSCIYPRLAPQPILESSLLTGPLESTNEAYAIAKIAGVKTCEAYRRQYGWDAISAMPTNLYGPGDNFDLQNSHVLPALIRKVHEAKQRGDSSVVVWGTGSPRREFMYVEDCADSLVFLLENYSGAELVNVGVGSDVTIKELAQTVVELVGFRGTLEFDTSKPDGTPRKLLDVSRLQGLGWHPRTSLRDGIALTYEWFVRNQADARQ
jgi:GDP-L-fucose synthase